MNRHSLKWQILLLFTMLFLGANGFTFMMVRGITRNRYDRYIERNDLRQAENLARLMGETWEKGGNWSSWEDWDPPIQGRPGPMMGNDRMMGGNRPRGMDQPGEGRELFILSPRGEILYQSSQEEQRLKPEIDRAVPILVEGDIGGYVLIGSMLGQSLSPEDQAFLRGLNRIYIFSSISFTLLGLFLAMMIINRLFSPLEKIHRATLKLSLGNYQARSGLDGKDEISRLGQSFDSMAHSIEQARLWKEQLIADTAHELRTPAALIQGTLEMIREGIYEPTPDKLDQLHREAESLSRLISEMQQLSSLEGNLPELEMEPIELEPFLQGILSSFLPLASNQSVELAWEIPEMDRPLEADPYRLRQVLQNLLKNALHYAPLGTTITLSVEIHPHLLRFILDDQGPGIPEADRERIFERFTRLDSSRNREEGSRGLGLAISRAIVEAHQGKIAAGKAPGGGARVWFQLPLP